MSAVATNTNSRNPNGSQTIKFFTSNSAAFTPTIWKQVRNLITPISNIASLVIPETIFSQAIDTTTVDTTTVNTTSMFVSTNQYTDISGIQPIPANTYNKILELIACENLLDNSTYFFGTTNSNNTFPNLTLTTTNVINESSLIPILVAKIQDLENRLAIVENNINT